MITDDEYFRLQQVVAQIRTRLDVDRVLNALDRLPDSEEKDNLLRNTLMMQANVVNG